MAAASLKMEERISASIDRINSAFERNMFGIFQGEQESSACCPTSSASKDNLELPQLEYFEHEAYVSKKEGSDSVGLAGIGREKVSERLVDVVERLQSLQSSLDNVYRQEEGTVHLSNVSFDEWLQEQVFQKEVEDMVISICFQSLQEEFEKCLWDLKAQFRGSQSVKWLERFNDCNLGHYLNTVYKSLSMPETEQLTFHGSPKNCEEWNNSKKTDHFNVEVSSSRVSSSTLLSKANGELESKSIMPENADPAQLKHMSKDEMMNYFETGMAKMKREQESEVQKMTEQNYSLKRDYLKERECFEERNKDLDIKRKNIPILKLNDILVKNEKSPASSDPAKNISSLKDRLDVPLSETRQLRDFNRLKDHKDQQESLVSESNIELDGLKSDLAEAQINLYEETNKLNQKLETTRVLLADTQDRQNTVMVTEAREEEHRKKKEPVILSGNKLANSVANFGDRVIEDRENICSRVKTANSDIQKLRGIELQYEQKLEKASSNLLKAEAEVDLLGEEVEALLSLLEKIYITLDHYSAVLKHYPGISDIIKLIGKKLSREST